MLENAKLLCHSSIRIIGNKIIYFDPFKIEKNFNDADYVFCTHSHFDHFSKEDIEKVKKDSTVIITVESSKNDAIGLVGENNVLIVKPNNNYEINGLKFSTIPSYNLEKDFHPKRNDWVGFIISIENTTYYIAGDTDNIPEIQDIECDVAFIPVGGKYTMNVEEAAKLANTLNCKVVVPTHYGVVAGNKEDGKEFAKLVVNKNVEVMM